MVQKLTPAQVQGMYSSLLTGGGRSGTGLAPRTVRYIHAILRRAMKGALGLELVSRNVTEAVSPPKASRPPIKTWDTLDLTALHGRSSNGWLQPTVAARCTCGHAPS